MKTIALEFLLAVFIVVLLHVPASIGISILKYQSASAVAAVSETESNTKNNPDSDRIIEVDRKYQERIKYTIVIIFAVLFIAGVYWWTYGKLHHKLPRY